MATTTTVVEVKRALIVEISALSVVSAHAASAPLVQVSYARPPVDQVRSESVWFAETATTSPPEYRMTAGRRRRMVTWGIDLVVSSQIISDAADAEERAFEIVAAIEDFLAAEAQPAEWTYAPVASGAMWVTVDSISVDHAETTEGHLRVEVTMTLEMKERLL